MAGPGCNLNLEYGRLHFHPSCGIPRWWKRLGGKHRVSCPVCVIRPPLFQHDPQLPIFNLNHIFPPVVSVRSSLSLPFYFIN